MRGIAVAASLSFVLLSGCVDWEAAKQRAIEDAQKQCDRDGKQFQLVSANRDEERRAVVVVAHCLGPDDPGYVKAVPSK